MADRPIDFVSSLNDIAAQIAHEYEAVWNNQVTSVEEQPYKPLNLKWMVTYNGQTFELKFIVPTYWKFVEFGTQPHDIAYTKVRKLKKGGFIAGPPIKTLMQWLTIKKGVPESQAFGKAIAIDKNIYYHDKRIHHPGSRGKALLSWTLHEHNDLIKQLCYEITRLMNVQVSEDLVTVFEGTKHIKLV